jgi:hypothetical protein
VTVLVGKLSQDFKDWMVALEYHEDLERVQDDLQSAFNIIKVCLVGMHDGMSNILHPGTPDSKSISYPRS